jgi:ribonuclease E
VAKVAAPAEKGFFGWLKSLFGGGEAPVVTAPPVAAPDAKTAERSEQRREGGRDSRGRGGRNGNEGRAPREGREAGRNTRGGEGRNVEGRPEGRESREGREGARRNEGRVDGRGEARGEPRGESRNGGRRDNRRDAAPLDQTQGTEVLLNAAPATGETPDMAEGQRRERRPRNDNRRRPQGAEGVEVAQQGSTDNAAPRLEPDARASGAEMPAAEGDADNGGQRAPRERRSRDRYGRDRRERAPRDAAEQGSETEAAPAMTVAPVDEVAIEAPVRSSYFSLPVESSPVAIEEVVAEVAPAVIEPVPVLATPAPRPVAVPEVRKSVPAAAPATRGLPKVEPYTVSIDELNLVAAASGLEWVNSDSDKVAQVQAAIAAEPKPIHVPREIKPPVVLDEGPLVLVETRKDLRSMPLPFETQ